jgi:mannose-6-phosphate isomerase-like protein (cupin superfamily)
MSTSPRPLAPVPAVFETEGAIRVDIRAEALINHAFLRVIHTGMREQIAVMTLPPYAEIGDEVRTDTDQLLIFVEGNGEARVADYELAVEAGDLVFVEAGTRHNIINRATLPLRLITVLAPSAYAAGTVIETMPVREPPVEARWRAFPWVPESSGLDS